MLPHNFISKLHPILLLNFKLYPPFPPLSSLFFFCKFLSFLTFRSPYFAHSTFFYFHFWDLPSLFIKQYLILQIYASPWHNNNSRAIQSHKTLTLPAFLSLINKGNDFFPLFNFLDKTLMKKKVQFFPCPFVVCCVFAKGFSCACKNDAFVFFFDNFIGFCLRGEDGIVIKLGI